MNLILQLRLTTPLHNKLPHFRYAIIIITRFKPARIMDDDVIIHICRHNRIPDASNVCLDILVWDPENTTRYCRFPDSRFADDEDAEAWTFVQDSSDVVDDFLCVATVGFG